MTIPFWFSLGIKIVSEMKFVFFFKIIALLFLFEGCKEQCTDDSFLEEGEIEIPYSNLKNSNSSRKIKIEIADNDYRRRLGLKGKECLSKDNGLLFIYDFEKSHSFWMKDTKIPLDLIFIDQNFKIVYMILNAKPLSTKGLISPNKAKYVLEVNSGIIKELGIKKNDSVHISYY